MFLIKKRLSQNERHAQFEKYVLTYIGAESDHITLAVRLAAQMTSVDDVLNNNCASLEVDVNKNYFLKIRFHPHDSITRSINFIDEVGYRIDEYFDTQENKSGYENVFNRKRLIFDSCGNQIDCKHVVQSDCKNISNFAHCYKEECVEGFGASTIPVVTYKFRRAIPLTIKLVVVSRNFTGIRCFFRLSTALFHCDSSYISSRVLKI